MRFRIVNFILTIFFNFIMHKKRKLWPGHVHCFNSLIESCKTGNLPPTVLEATNPIFDANSASKEQQIWTVKRFKSQPGPKPSCASHSCSQQFKPGDLCVSVEGLYIPPNKTNDGQSFSVRRTYQFKNASECYKAWW